MNPIFDPVAFYKEYQPLDIETYRLNIEQLAEYADIAIQIRQKIDARADVVENLI